MFARRHADRNPQRLYGTGRVGRARKCGVCGAVCMMAAAEIDAGNARSPIGSPNSTKPSTRPLLNVATR